MFMMLISFLGFMRGNGRGHHPPCLHKWVLGLRNPPNRWPTEKTFGVNCYLQIIFSNFLGLITLVKKNKEPEKLILAFYLYFILFDFQL